MRISGMLGSLFRTLLLPYAIVSAVLTLLILAHYTVPSLAPGGRFTWQEDLLFPAGVLASGLAALAVRSALRKRAPRRALALALVAGVASSLVAGCVPVKTDDFGALPYYLPAVPIRTAASDYESLRWHGMHLGLPVDSVHIYSEVAGAALYLWVDPHWLFLNFSVVFAPLYTALVGARAYRANRLREGEA